MGDWSRGLTAAWRLAIGRADAIEPLGDSLPALRGSFWAMPACLPPLAIILLAQRRNGLLDAPHWRTVVAELLVGVVGWLAFLEVGRVVAERRGVGARWPRFAALWNWSNLTGLALSALGALPAWLPVPPIAASGVAIVFFVWAVMVEWIAIRVGLGLPTVFTAALLAFDISLGVVLDGARVILSGHLG